MSKIVGFHIYSHDRKYIIIMSPVKTVHKISSVDSYSIEFTEDYVLVHITWKNSNYKSVYIIDLELLDMIDMYFPHN